MGISVSNMKKSTLGNPISFSVVGHKPENLAVAHKNLNLINSLMTTVSGMLNVQCLPCSTAESSMV